MHVYGALLLYLDVQGGMTALHGAGFRPAILSKRRDQLRGWYAAQVTAYHGRRSQTPSARTSRTRGSMVPLRLSVSCAEGLFV